LAQSLTADVSEIAEIKAISPGDLSTVNRTSSPIANSDDHAFDRPTIGKVTEDATQLDSASPQSNIR
jgi:hypothetical protein